jgi:hypothetical protein
MDIATNNAIIYFLYFVLCMHIEIKKGTHLWIPGKEWAKEIGERRIPGDINCLYFKATVTNIIKERVSDSINIFLLLPMDVATNKRIPVT